MAGFLLAGLQEGWGCGLAAADFLGLGRVWLGWPSISTGCRGVGPDRQGAAFPGHAV